MSWNDYVTATTQLGFSKVCLIARANYQTLATTNAQTDIATAWVDKNADGTETQINENQELLDNWFDVKKSAFAFFGKKFNIVFRSEDEGAIVCAKGNEIICAREFKSIWFVAFGMKKSMKAKKEDPGFKGAQDALTQISGSVWDGLAEAGM